MLGHLVDGGSARASRLVGSWATLGWVMLIGTLVTVPLTLLFGSGADLTPDAITLLVISGAANVVGLLFAYSAFRRGQVAVVAPILSTEGAMAAVIAVVFGEQVGIAAALLLTAIAAGIVLASSGGADEPAAAEPGGLVTIPDGPRATGMPRTARVDRLGVAVRPRRGRLLRDQPLRERPDRRDAAARLVGHARPARRVPVRRPADARDRPAASTRVAAPFVVVVAVAEVAGTAAYAFGARDGIAVAAVMSSQFGAIAALVSVVLFGERLRRIQVVGVGIIAAGVAVLAALRRPDPASPAVGDPILYSSAWRPRNPTAATPRFTMVVLLVADLARSVAFYRRLGVTFPEDAETRRDVVVELGGGHNLVLTTTFGQNVPDLELAPGDGRGDAGVLRGE